VPPRCKISESRDDPASPEHTVVGFKPTMPSPSLARGLTRRYHVPPDRSAHTPPQHQPALPPGTTMPAFALSWGSTTARRASSVRGVAKPDCFHLCQDDRSCAVFIFCTTNRPAGGIERSSKRPPCRRQSPRVVIVPDAPMDREAPERGPFACSFASISRRFDGLGVRVITAAGAGPSR